MTKVTHMIWFSTVVVVPSGVSRGVFWLPGNPPLAMIFLIRGMTPLLALTLTSHLHLRRSETPLDTNSGYATGSRCLSV